MSTYYNKDGIAPTSAYVEELFTPVLKVTLTEEGADKLAKMLEVDNRIYTSSKQAVTIDINPIEMEKVIAIWKIIQEKKVDILFDIFKRNNYEEYCDYFNRLYSEGDPDFCVYKQLLTEEEFELLHNSISNPYITI